MAKYLNNNSSNRNQMHQPNKTTVLASCYSVNQLTSAVKGFHYCTTTGAGMCFLLSRLSFILFLLMNCEL